LGSLTFLQNTGECLNSFFLEVDFLHRSLAVLVTSQALYTTPYSDTVKKHSLLQFEKYQRGLFSDAQIWAVNSGVRVRG
jgi:hypothetical protein